MKSRIVSRTVDVESGIACAAVCVFLDQPATTTVRFCPEQPCSEFVEHIVAFNMTCLGRVFHVGMRPSSGVGKLIEEGSQRCYSFSYTTWDGKVEIMIDAC